MMQLARDIAADAFDKSHGGRMAISQRMREGKADDHEMVQCALAALHNEGERVTEEMIERGAIAISNVERKHISLEPLTKFYQIFPSDRPYIVEEARACLEAALGERP